jgi:flagellar protein FliS
MTAPPEELRLMLLEGAVKFAAQGRDGLKSRNFEASFNGLSQCRDIVVELITTIRADADPDMADRVRAVYTFIYNELTQAGFDKDAGRLDKVVKLLEYELETWQMLISKLADERAAGTSPPPPAQDRVAFSVQG